jgi:hypothetical protein
VNLVNESPLFAAWTIGFQRDGHEAVIVVAKGTYVFVGSGGEPARSDDPVPICKADEFGDDPATTAPRFETDFAHTKRYCDVLVHGQAHAPHGTPVRSLVTSLRVGPVRKSIRVLGRRVWIQNPVSGLGASHPASFVAQQISYDHAFGGVDRHPDDPTRIETFLDNPAGRGFYAFNTKIDGAAMPWTEEEDRPIADPRTAYRPMSYGPLGRHWRPRARFAGTYDARWLDERCPLWPEDFDERYFQSAPEDQQMPFPKGGEVVELTNLVPPALAPSASAATRLPRSAVGVVFVPHIGPVRLVRANLDTIVIEPDANRFSCTWRAVQPTERDAFEIREMVVGDPDGGLVGKARARAAGKEYVAGLGKLPKGRVS